MGSEDPEEGEAEQKGDGGSNSLEALAAKLKALQRSKHTLELVCDIFSDFRVRKLGFMCLSRYQVTICVHWLPVLCLGKKMIRVFLFLQRYVCGRKQMVYIYIYSLSTCYGLRPGSTLLRDHCARTI